MTPDPRAATPVALAELARWVDGELHGPTADVVVDDLVQDSRLVQPGSLFICITGATSDGHGFAADAVDAGAVALLVERRLDLDVAQVVVPDTRRAVGPLAAAFLGRPADDLEIIGITGTNGKTTVAHLIMAIFSAAGRPAATIGTLTGGHTTPTTPEALDLHRDLARLRDGGTEVVTLEVSSHALAMHRVDGLVVDVAVFTNLSRDHLDFHGTMESYFQAKATLFTPEHASRAVVNLDDPNGRLLQDAAQIPTVGYHMDDAADVVLAPDHSTFTWEGHEVRLPLVGRVNVSNALAAARVAQTIGVDTAAIVAGLGAVAPIHGRFERIELSSDFGAMVDYAHTPDALARLLESARELCPQGRVHLVFGCGGDKDRTKRGPMGEVASRLADHVVLTSDNPRSERPEDIIDDIRRGTGSDAAIEVEPDRRRAIALAIAAAEPGDLVVVAGKGHESEQILGSTAVPFDDVRVVIEEHERMAGGST